MNSFARLDWKPDCERRASLNSQTWQIRLRKRLLLPIDSRWNGWVRDFTSWLEKPWWPTFLTPERLRRKAYPYQDGDLTVIGPECFTDPKLDVISYKGENYISSEHVILALGYLSAEFAHRAGAWGGKAPDWFPEPPEWLEIWNAAIDAARVHDDQTIERP